MAGLTSARVRREGARFARLSAADRPAAPDGRAADAVALADQLERALLERARGEVRFDAGSRALY
ncbi:MAG TPA: hypothetical protein VHR43_10715, partial [Gemmatimonadales bacterium]|nr:hypothetical protein [Gemmatimonadales bacterium]